MPDSTYKIIELVGTSKNSWEEAAKNAVETASQTLRDLRIAEISELDMKIEDGKVVAYRARVKVSFKYLGKEQFKSSPKGMNQAGSETHDFTGVSCQDLGINQYKDEVSGELL